jgi:hypothetical protein
MATLRALMSRILCLKSSTIISLYNSIASLLSEFYGGVASSSHSGVGRFSTLANSARFKMRCRSLLKASGAWLCLMRPIFRLSSDMLALSSLVSSWSPMSFLTWTRSGCKFLLRAGFTVLFAVLSLETPSELEDLRFNNEAGLGPDLCTGL